MPVFLFSSTRWSFFYCCRLPIFYLFYMAWRLLLEVIQVDVNIHREIQIICRLEKLERNDPKPKNNCYRWESCFLLYQIVLRYLINSMGLNRSNRNSDGTFRGLDFTLRFVGRSLGCGSSAGNCDSSTALCSVDICFEDHSISFAFRTPSSSATKIIKKLLSSATKVM